MLTQADVYHSLHYHIIFGTKERAPLITSVCLDKISALSQDKAKELDSNIYIINGSTDHIHLLASLPPKRSISEFVKHIKGYTSYSITGLSWQRGYAAFTVDKGSCFRNDQNRAGG